jgi:F-type H+-transporting ATPase subunit b
MLVTPGVGLIIWMTLSFLVLLWLLGKFAWKPILKSLHDREDSIENALNAAEKAREEMKQLQVDNEKILKEAKQERDNLLKDARKMRENMIEEAKSKANEEAERIIQTAKDNIHYEKMAAITELKNQIAKLSIEIAEDILKEKLQDSEKQKEIINKQLENVNFN